MKSTIIEAFNLEAGEIQLRSLADLVGRHREGIGQGRDVHAIGCADGDRQRTLQIVIGEPDLRR